MYFIFYFTDSNLFLKIFDNVLFQTLERAYLLKVNGVVHERPQQMFMRVSIGIHGNDIDKAIEVLHIFLMH